MNGHAQDGHRCLEVLPWGPERLCLEGGVAATHHGQDPTRDSTSRGDSPLAGSGLTRRGVIYEYIRTHPGIHVRGLAKGLGFATGDLQYHLLWLERHGLVKARKGGFFRYLYPANVFKEEQKVLLGALSQETPREVLLFLLSLTAVTQSELCSALGLSQPTISWQVDRLVRLGLIRGTRTGRETVYEVTADGNDIKRFVSTYHPEVWKRWVGKFAGVLVSARIGRADKEGFSTWRG